MARGSWGKRIGIGAATLVAAVLVVLFATPFGKGLRDIAGTGAVQEAMRPHEDRRYEAKGTEDNLKALFTGLKGYQESEGQYPDADRWMDQLLPRLILSDLPKKEAQKKLVRPGVPEGGFGYALNDAVAGKYVGDLPKGTVLLFESATTGRNAHGDPKRDAIPGARGLTIEGEIKGL